MPKSANITVVTIQHFEHFLFLQNADICTLFKMMYIMAHLYLLKSRGSNWSTVCNILTSLEIFSGVQRDDTTEKKILFQISMRNSFPVIHLGQFIPYSPCTSTLLGCLVNSKKKTSTLTINTKLLDFNVLTIIL